MTERGANTSDNGVMATASSTATVRWVSGSNARRLSTVSP